MQIRLAHIVNNDDRAQEVLDKLKTDGWDVIEQRQSEGWYSFLCR